VNVKELKEILAQYPDDMEILYRLYSDYEMLNADDISVVEAVDQNGYWMRTHPTMSADNQSRKSTYLLFPGN